jgi:hypothetical protein
LDKKFYGGKNQGIIEKITRFVLKIKSSIPVRYAQFWQYYYRYKNWFLSVATKHRVVFTAIVLLVLIVTNWLLAPKLHSVLEPYFSVQDRFDSFRTLLVTLGGALIGSTAIAFSLIMFAMQVNVERMSYGLFRKFSSDLKLLGSFAITFGLAIAITCSSLIPDKSWVPLATFGAMWCSVLIVIFFLVAYRRALNLISPTKQLSILVVDTKKNLGACEKAARRAAPLLKSKRGEVEKDHEHRSDHDMERVTYFQINPGWTAVALRGIAHCISFSHRYAEQGDYEVSGFALNAILSINAAYIKAKGKTFFSQNFLINNSFTSDGFINDTLEHLRQNVRVGVSRGDEQQIEQIFRAMEKLCQIYLNIDYASEHASKTHAHLAAAYLADAVESVVPQNMPDVLMEGVRLMGNAAQLIISYKEPEHIATISEKIALIACTGTVNQKYHPVTQVAVMQLAKLTFDLIRSQSHDVSFAIGEVRSDVKLIAEMFLKIPDTPLSNIHSASLSPYYSGTSNDTLMAWLAELNNAISNAGKDDEAQRIIYHIKQWADELYQTEKELFLLAIEKRSHFTFDIIHWIVHITKLLLAVSNADACDDHNREKLRRSALWLVSVLSWVPDEQEVVTFIENYQMTESLFEAAIDARQCGCNDIALEIRDLLLFWGFKAGKYQTGLGILERACYGLACLHIIFELDNSFLLRAIEDRVVREGANSLEFRFRASEKIREKANNYHPDRYALQAIESVMAQVDQKKLRTLLTGIADQLIPEQVNQPEEEN